MLLPAQLADELEVRRIQNRTVRDRGIYRTDRTVHSRRRGRDQGVQAQTGLIFVKARLEGFEE